MSPIEIGLSPKWAFICWSWLISKKRTKFELMASQKLNKHRNKYRP